MLRKCFATLLFAGLTGGLPLFAQEPGDTVVVIQEVTIPHEKAGQLTLSKGDLVTVEEVQADKLRINSPELPNRPSVSAWVARQNLVPLIDSLAFFDAQIKAQPTAYSHSIRGLIWSSKEDYDKAIADFNAAIQLEPQVSTFYHDRGFAWEHKQDFAKALKDYQEAIRLDPQNPEPHNDAAWVWATCTDAKLRDPRKAVEHATKAAELTQYKEWNFLDTLAAACAAAGDFANAVKWESQAIQGAPAELQAEMKSRLQLYQAGKPFVETLQPNRPQ